MASVVNPCEVINFINNWLLGIIKVIASLPMLDSFRPGCFFARLSECLRPQRKSLGQCFLFGSQLVFISGNKAFRDDSSVFGLFSQFLVGECGGDCAVD